MWLCPVSGPVNAKVMILRREKGTCGGDDLLVFRFGHTQCMSLSVPARRHHVPSTLNVPFPCLRARASQTSTVSPAGKGSHARGRRARRRAMQK